MAIATEYSGASRGTLLLDHGDGLEPVLALGPELRAAPRDASSFDAALVEQARSATAAWRPRAAAWRRRS